MKTLAQGSAYERSLIDSIENIRLLVKKIKEQASQCMQERLCGVDQTVVRVDRNVSRLDANVLSIMQRVDDLPQSLAQDLAQTQTQALYRLLQSNPLVDRRTGQGMLAQGSKRRSQLTMASLSIDWRTWYARNQRQGWIAFFGKLTACIPRACDIYSRSVDFPYAWRAHTTRYIRLADAS